MELSEIMQAVKNRPEDLADRFKLATERFFYANQFLSIPLG
jgi:hypothetical protein